MTKAERIYLMTYTKCKNHVLANGKPGDGFQRVSTRPDEKVFKRTLNAVEKFLKEDEELVEWSIERGINVKRNEANTWTLWMVRKTIENNRAALA